MVLLQDGLLFPISIHAPLRGRREHPLHFFYKGKFQSTPPCGGDFGFHGSPSHELTFQSTPPCGGDTGKNFISASAGRFQSTPPCGGDHGCILFTVAYSYFNPRPPCGGDPEPIINADQLKNFNPRPLAGATGRDGTQLDGARISIHAPLRGRPKKRLQEREEKKFQSTPPCGGDLYPSWIPGR